MSKNDSKEPRRETEGRGKVLCHISGRINALLSPAEPAFSVRSLWNSLKALGCRDIFVPRSKDYDLVQMDAVKQLYTDKLPTWSSILPHGSEA